MAEVTGKGTKVEVSTDGTTFETLCVFNNEATVDYGEYAVNEEFCLSSNDPAITRGKRTYGEYEYIHKWEEGNGSAGNKIVKDAHVSGDEIYVRVEATNSGGTNGTQYTSKFIVTKYKHTFKDSEMNKSVWSCKQTTEPVEVASA